MGWAPRRRRRRAVQLCFLVSCLRSVRRRGVGEKKNLRASHHDEQEDDDDARENNPATPVVPSAVASVRVAVAVAVVVSLNEAHDGGSR